MAGRAQAAGGDARRKITHDQVLQAAAQQMNRRGVAATLLKDVAKQLGVTRMALYRYVGDREDLVFQCYLRTCAGLEAATDEAADAPDLIDAFVRSVLGAERPELCAVVESGLLPRDKHEAVRARFDGVASRLADLLRQRAQRGEVRRCDFELAARGILNVIFWVPVSDLWNTAKYEDRAEVLRVTTDFIRHGWASDRSRLPDYAVLDISAIGAPVVEAFDRGAIADARREKILAVASRLFNEKGIDSTTLDDVAQQLGATSGAISHHVGDKPALVAACYVRTLEMATALQQQANARPGSALARVAAFQHAWSLVQMRHWPLMPLTGFEALPQSGQQAFHDLLLSLTVATLTLVDAGAADRSMRRLPRYAVRLQSGVIGWLARSGIGDVAKQDSVAKEIAMLVAVGIGPLRSVL